MNTDHIISNSQTQRMECQHCGFTQAVKMPVPLDDLLSQFDAFMEAHKDCQRPQSEAVMSEYIKGFDAGYGYVLQEVENYIKQYPDNKFALTELLAHLKMEDKTDLGKIPTK
jgi:uncharacterized Fe-S cluster-containing MiaB family protein